MKRHAVVFGGMVMGILALCATALLPAGVSPAMVAGQKIVSTDTPLAEIRDIFTFFHTPSNVVQIQVASDQTLYAWQNMSGFQYTMQILRDGPISDLPVKLDPATCWSLVDKLLEKGYSESDCKKFLGGNFYRVSQQVWR